MNGTTVLRGCSLTKALAAVAYGGLFVVFVAEAMVFSAPWLALCIALHSLPLWYAVQLHLVPAAQVALLAALVVLHCRGKRIGGPWFFLNSSVAAALWFAAFVVLNLWEVV